MARPPGGSRPGSMSWARSLPRQHQKACGNHGPGLTLGLPEIGEDLLERGDDFVSLGLAFPETQFQREVLVVRTVVERERFWSPRLWLRSRPAHFIARGRLVTARDSLHESGHFLGVRL